MTITVEQFFKGLPGWQRDMCQELHDLIQETAPELAVEFKWSRPVYELNGQVCDLQPHSEHVNVGFRRGADLSQQHDLLQGSGKSMRHVKIRQGDEIPRQALREILLEAVQIDREHGSKFFYLRLGVTIAVPTGDRLAAGCAGAAASTV